MSAKITAALHAVMQDVPYVQRTGKNAFHNYRYAGEADLLEKLRPALLRHGLLLIPSAQEASPADQHGNVTVRVEYTLAHKDGDVWPDKIGAVGCGNDRSRDGKVGDKGVYKALTGANKYLLFKLFQIETGDDPETEELHHPEPAIEAPKGSERVTSQSRAVYVDNSIQRIAGFDFAAELLQWAQTERAKVWPQYGIDAHDEDGQRIVKVYKDRMAVLEGRAEAA